MKILIGIGNKDRGDDGIGPAVVERVARQAPAGTVVRVLGGDAAGLLQAWEGAELAVVVDAAWSGRTPGTVHRLDATAAPLPASLGATSTHGLGLAQAVELARALGQLPPRLVVYAIEAASFAPGEGISPALASAVEEAAARIVAELEEQPCTSCP
ncbi:MAG: hydrogenase maturation protease [Myxococcales bacterium]|nr:hydrogenase maturation protease [Myxococcota bacterium]MDW8283696.1 hydrogenase maturation protease [Myxococcales bacterium]